MLSIFKNHVDGLVFQNHFLESNDILMIYFFIQLVYRFYMSFKSRTIANKRTAISRIALWLIPVYAVTSPSLSGLNFLIACIVPSSSRLCALYTRPYVPEEMNPRMLYFERTEWWLASRLARYMRIGSCWSALDDHSSSITSGKGAEESYASRDQTLTMYCVQVPSSHILESRLPRSNSSHKIYFLRPLS